MIEMATFCGAISKKVKVVEGRRDWIDDVDFALFVEHMDCALPC